MKCHKLFFIGTLTIAMVLGVPVQAAVYGTLKDDIDFEVEGNHVMKTAGTSVRIIDEDESNYLIYINQEHQDVIEKGLVELPGIITKTNTKAAIVEEISQNAKVLENIDEDEMVMVLEKESSFYKIKVNDTVGYIYSTSVDESKLTSLIEACNNERKGEEVVSYAKQFLGGKYVYGGTNLSTGVDCSGFTQQVYKHFNISIARTAREQYAKSGHVVSQSEMMAGDLIYYGYENVDHVAIYAGDDQIIHASTESTGIIMSKMYYGKPIVGIKRVIE